MHEDLFWNEIFVSDTNECQSNCRVNLDFSGGGVFILRGKVCGQNHARGTNCPIGYCKLGV